MKIPATYRFTRSIRIELPDGPHPWSSLSADQRNLICSRALTIARNYVKQDDGILVLGLNCFKYILESPDRDFIQVDLDCQKDLNVREI